MSALLLIVVSAVIGVVVLLTRRWAVVARALAPAGSGLRVRSRVKLQVDESAVVLALWD